MRCATLVPKSGDTRIVLVALGFLSYCLYTDADSAAGNLVASLATTTLPVPYDTFSLGMVAVLGAGASLPRVCTLLFDEKFLMAGIALMTIGPLYSMLVGAGYAVYVLAFCGGLGKAVVLLHLGRCLFLLGARSAFYVVAAMGALSALAAPILSLHHAAFSLASLVAAPVCGWCLYRASIAKAPCAGADKDDAIGLDGTVRDFPRYIAMVVILASCTILLLDPMTGGFGCANRTAYVSAYAGRSGGLAGGALPSFSKFGTSVMACFQGDDLLLHRSRLRLFCICVWQEFMDVRHLSRLCVVSGNLLCHGAVCCMGKREQRHRVYRYGGTTLRHGGFSILRCPLNGDLPLPNTTRCSGSFVLYFHRCACRGYRTVFGHNRGDGFTRSALLLL